MLGTLTLTLPRTSALTITIMEANTLAHPGEELGEKLRQILVWIIMMLGSFIPIVPWIIILIIIELNVPKLSHLL